MADPDDPDDQDSEAEESTPENADPDDSWAIAQQSFDDSASGMRLEFFVDATTGEPTLQIYNATRSRLVRMTFTRDGHCQRPQTRVLSFGLPEPALPDPVQVIEQEASQQRR